MNFLPKKPFNFSNMPFVELIERSDYTSHDSDSRQRNVTCEGALTMMWRNDDFNTLKEAIIDAFTDQDQLHLEIRVHRNLGRLLVMPFTVSFFTTDQKT